MARFKADVGVNSIDDAIAGTLEPSNDKHSSLCINCIFVLVPSAAGYEECDRDPENMTSRRSTSCEYHNVMVNNIQRLDRRAGFPTSSSSLDVLHLAERGFLERLMLV